MTKLLQLTKDKTAASIKYNISYSHLPKMLDGKRNNNTSLKYK